MRLVYLALAWSGGILVAANSPDRRVMVWLLLSLAAVLLLWSARARHGQRLGLLLLLVFMLGGLRLSLTPVSSDVASYNQTGGLTLQGVVAAEPSYREAQVQLRIAVESVERGGSVIPSSGLVLVEAPRIVNVQVGDRIRATGELLLPGMVDAFSYADFLGRQGVFSLMPRAAVEVINHAETLSPLAVLLTVKARLRESIAAALPEPGASLLTGILLGDERGIAPELADDFAATGAAHIIAISGFNMLILSRVVMRLLEQLRLAPRWSAILALLVIGIYTLLVGANPAVVRAALMSGLLIVGAVIGRRTFAPASLAFAALVLSLINPFVLWDASFQLSLAAAFGLSLFADPLSIGVNRLLRQFLPFSLARRVGDFLTEPLVASLAAQIMVIPLIALYFERLSLVSVAVNLLIVPVQPLILLVGGSAALLSFVLPTAAQALFWLVAVPLGWTIGVVRAFADLPFADVVFRVDGRLIMLFFAGVGSVAAARAVQPLWLLKVARLLWSRLVLTATLLAGAGLLTLIGALYLSRPDQRLHVWFLDMGHANAVLLQTPGGAHVLVDGGRFPSRLLTALGDRLPFNDRTLELLVLTQPDENEFAALNAAVERYTVGAVLSNGQPNQGDPWLALQDALTGSERVTVAAGHSIDLGDGSYIEVLHPSTVPTLADSLDDGALMLRVRYGAVSFLLMGDASSEAQRALLDAGGWSTATVMQLPTHGAARSLDETFLAMLQPSVIVAQIDPANRRGDPDADVLALLPAVPLLRTDELGTIHFWTDGENLWYQPERAN
jgi:competence protein ComEC